MKTTMFKYGDKEVELRLTYSAIKIINGVIEGGLNKIQKNITENNIDPIEIIKVLWACIKTNGDDITFDDFLKAIEDVNFIDEIIPAVNDLTLNSPLLSAKQSKKVKN